MTKAEKPITHEQSTSGKTLGKRVFITLLLVISLAILVIAGGMVYKQYQGQQSPAFALRKVQKAISTQNVALFERYVDSRALAEKSLLTISEPPQENNNTPAVSNYFWEQLIPALSIQLRDDIKDAVKTGKLQGPSVLFSTIKLIFGDKITITKIDSIKTITGGATALLHAKSAENDDVILEIKLKQNLNRYEIVEIINLQKLLKEALYRQHIAKQERNADIKQKMAKTIHVNDQQLAISPNGQVLLRLAVENTDDQKDIDHFVANIKVIDTQNSLRHNLLWQENSGIFSQNILERTWTLPIKLNIDKAPDTISNTESVDNYNPLAGWLVNVEINKINFVDGSALKLEN